MMLLMAPPVARHLSAISVAAAVMGAKAMPPLWQYFSRLQSLSGSLSSCGPVRPA
jgi:hypothetical protein